MAFESIALNKQPDVFSPMEDTPLFTIQNNRYEQWFRMLRAKLPWMVIGCVGLALTTYAIYLTPHPPDDPSGPLFYTGITVSAIFFALPVAQLLMRLGGGIEIGAQTLFIYPDRVVRVGRKNRAEISLKSISAMSYEHDWIYGVGLWLSGDGHSISFFFPPNPTEIIATVAKLRDEALRAPG